MKEFEFKFCTCEGPFGDRPGSTNGICHRCCFPQCRHMGQHSAGKCLDCSRPLLRCDCGHCKNHILALRMSNEKR